MPLCAVPLDPSGCVNSVHSLSRRRRTEHLLGKGRLRLGGADPSGSTGVSHLSSTHYPRVFNHPLSHPPCSCLRHLCVESEGVFRRWRTNSCAASQVVSDTTTFFGTLRVRLSLRQPPGRKLCLFAFRPWDDRNTCSQIRFPSPDMDSKRGWWGRTYAKVLLGE